MKPFACRLLCAAVLGLTAFRLEAQEEISADKLPKKVSEAAKARFPDATFVKITKEMEINEIVYDIELTVAGKKHEMDCKEDRAKRTLR